ncbi:replication-relaxation family protein [Streptomyces phaeochromogenes]|uniref:replication-relaxation family protein n=1 Tax=Streptomyces phaeochromogenes TaxID=1923 RepID=UPI002E28833D|nr:replication-relaxation family protein [Streptomyces phaeochromogenes]
MIGVDVGSGDRLALGVLAQYRMATTEQMHRVIAPSVRIEQTRRRLARLRVEGLVDRITLPQAGRTRVWFPTSYGVQLTSEWPEMRGRRPSRTVSDPTAVRLKAGHALTVTETALAFLKDARRHGDLCRPLDWIPEVHHPIGSGEAVIPDALLYYRRGPVDGDNGSMLRAFVEVDRATMGPECLAAKLTAYERLHRYVPLVPGRRPTLQEPAVEEWRRRTRSSPVSCSSWMAPDRPVSRTGSAPCTRGPGYWLTFRTTSPSSRRRWPTCSSTAPPHPCGGPSTTPAGESAGRNPVIARPDARPPQTRHGSVLRFARRPFVAK